MNRLVSVPTEPAALARNKTLAYAAGSVNNLANALANLPTDWHTPRIPCQFAAHFVQCPIVDGKMMKYIVHYGAIRSLGVFSYDERKLQYGNHVIVKTPRGHEAGIVRCEATTEALAKLESGFVEDRIVRPMTGTDEAEYRSLRRREREDLERCRQIVQEMSVIMDLVRMERIFGGERIVIYYTAEGRIDFRELVKVLAAEFQIRIEMRQITMRDGMKLLSNVGDCGREVCCTCYLHEMPIVSIKMAKLQRVTLDPAKISGHCGRLKCCLRYEYDCYVKEQHSGERSYCSGRKKLTEPDA